MEHPEVWEPPSLALARLEARMVPAVHLLAERKEDAALCCKESQKPFAHKSIPERSMNDFNHIHTCICTHMYACICVYMCIYIITHIYIYYIYI